MTDDRVFIFDTTLRDGEQSPGISLNATEKLEIAHQLARLGVDVIEAGFPITSPGDFEAVQAIARQVEGPVIAGLARVHVGDVDAAYGAVRDAARPRIHTFVSTSDIHIEHQLASTREDVKGQARAAVAHARELVEDVEFSPMDATRSDVEYTAEVVQIAIDEGATTINIPDTVGYTMPDEFQGFLGRLYELVPDLRDVVLSVHCHDDLGLAVANSFAGLQAGARQVECAINGIGERAGNAALEEIVMLLHTRAADVGYATGINTREIAKTSRLVSRLTGYMVQPNKAIVGRNAFAHESGIHQDGVLKERSTYEIMDATTVGLDANSIVLGKHSGRHALKSALEELGFEVTGQTLNTAFKRFKDIADKKKQVTALDLEALVTDELRDQMRSYTLEWFEVEASSRRPPHATVELRTPDGELARGDFTGDGPIDAIFRAINAASKREARLREFHIGSVTGGQDALGEASVVLELAGQSAAGQGVSTDIIEAAALAYVRALSNAERRVLAAAEPPSAEAAEAELSADAVGQRFRATQISSEGHWRAHATDTCGKRGWASAGARSSCSASISKPVSRSSPIISPWGRWNSIEGPSASCHSTRWRPNCGRASRSVATSASGAEQSTSSGVLVRKTSRPRGRSSRAASAIQRAGSHHRLAPYSDSAKSKLASGSGTFSASASISGNSMPCSRLHRARGGELALRLVDADGPRAAAGEPGREVGGAAAELDRVEPVDVGERADVVLRDAPHAPVGVRARPVELGRLDPLVGHPVPQLPVDVLVAHLASARPCA